MRSQAPDEDIRMRRTIFPLIAATSILATLPLSAAAQSINDRQAALEGRIEAGVRNGALTRAEAASLRSDFAALSRLEAQYRSTRPGLTAAERDDLNRRFDRLSQQVRNERRDGQVRDDSGERNVNARQRDIETRIATGVRNGSLTRREAAQLQTEFEAIERMEQSYRDSGRGLTQVERQYLDRRFDALERRLRQDRRDEDLRWTRLDERQAAFDRQLDQAARERRIGAREAQNLRAEFRTVARLERQYRSSRPGITPAERADLNRRFDRMEANLRASTSPTDNLVDLLFGIAR